MVSFENLTQYRENLQIACHVTQCEARFTIATFATISSCIVPSWWSQSFKWPTLMMRNLFLNNYIQQDTKICFVSLEEKTKLFEISIFIFAETFQNLTCLNCPDTVQKQKSWRCILLILLIIRVLKYNNLFLLACEINHVCARSFISRVQESLAAEPCTVRILEHSQDRKLWLLQFQKHKITYCTN